RSPYVSSKCSVASSSPRRRPATSAASRSTRTVPVGTCFSGSAIASAWGALIESPRCPCGHVLSSSGQGLESGFRVQRQVLLQLVHALFHDPDVLGHFGHEDGAFEGGHEEMRGPLRVAVGPELPSCLPPPPRLREPCAPPPREPGPAAAGTPRAGRTPGRRVGQWGGRGRR